MRQKLYGGFVNGKLHTWTEAWTEAKGHKEYTHRRTAVFSRRADAKREYEDVRELRVTAA